MAWCLVPDASGVEAQMSRRIHAQAKACSIFPTAHNTPRHTHHHNHKQPAISSSVFCPLSHAFGFVVLKHCIHAVVLTFVLHACPITYPSRHSTTYYSLWWPQQQTARRLQRPRRSAGPVGAIMKRKTARTASTLTGAKSKSVMVSPMLVEHECVKTPELSAPPSILLTYLIHSIPFKPHKIKQARWLLSETHRV